MKQMYFMGKTRQTVYVCKKANRGKKQRGCGFRQDAAKLEAQLADVQECDCDVCRELSEFADSTSRETCLEGLSVAKRKHAHVVCDSRYPEFGHESEGTQKRRVLVITKNGYSPSPRSPPSPHSLPSSPASSSVWNNSPGRVLGGKGGGKRRRDRGHEAANAAMKRLGARARVGEFESDTVDLSGDLQWMCEKCTVENPSTAGTCSMCSSPAPDWIADVNGGSRPGGGGGGGGGAEGFAGMRFEQDIEYERSLEQDRQKEVEREKEKDQERRAAAEKKAVEDVAAEARRAKEAEEEKERKRLSDRAAGTVLGGGG